MESVRCKRCTARPDTSTDADPGTKVIKRGENRVSQGKVISSPQADLNDVTDDFAIRQQLDILLEVSADLVANTIARLPNGKATGPDSFSNELLKLIAPDIK